jgi:hypothetical protein
MIESALLRGCITEQHTPVRRLPDSGNYITGHGWHEGKLGDFDGDGDLDILNNPYIWEALIEKMSRENPLWGVPRIQAELRLLGLDLAESTVAKYRIKSSTLGANIDTAG